jgi:hypothetical protein
MRALGYALITLGFLAGAFVAVRQADGVAVAPFLAALAVGVAGVVLVRVSLHREARHEDTLVANIGAIEESLVQLVERAEALAREKAGEDVYELRHRIDREFPPALDRFVVARDSIAHSFGLQAYADVMNPFAAGERSLNRVWSASTDGYVDEAHEYVDRARDFFAEALQVFRGLQRG